MTGLANAIMRLDASFLLGERRQHVPSVHGSAPKPLDHRISQHALQLAAVDGELHPLLPSLHPARPAPDLMSGTVGADQLPLADDDLIETRHHPALGHLRDGVRHHDDAEQ